MIITLCRVAFFIIITSAVWMYVAVWQALPNMELAAVIIIPIVFFAALLMYAIAMILWMYGFEKSQYAKTTIWIVSLAILFPWIPALIAFQIKIHLSKVRGY